MKNKEASFEQAMQELEDILQEMSDDGISLEESIEMYARAATLINSCDKKLNKATLKVQEIEEKLAEMEKSDDL